MRYNLLFTIVFLFVACNADPNLISDDEQAPKTPSQPLTCDSLYVPNSIFPNDIGEELVFADSAKAEFDTLHCIANSALNIQIKLPNDEYCEPQYKTAFSTNWLPLPEVYQLEFSSTLLPSHLFLSAQSVNLDDFLASSVLGYEAATIYQDSILVNGNAYKSVFQYHCMPGKPCTFAQSFVFALNKGMVAFQREGKWWTKI